MLSLDEEVAAAQLVRYTMTEGYLKDIQSLKHDDDQMQRALESALQNPDTNDFDAGVLTAATMLRDGARLPNWLALFAADVLEGKRKRPSKRGPDPYANWIRDYSLARAVLAISAQFDLPEYTNNELSIKTTAAEIVAETTHVSLEVVHKAVQKFGGKIKGNI